LKDKYNYEDVYVLSKDTDCLVFGAPKWLKDYNSENDTFNYFNLDNVLSKLNLTYQEFQIACVCMGCDFNTNQMLKIPKNKLTKYGSLKVDKLINSVRNTTSLSDYHKKISKEVMFDLELYTKALICFNESYHIEINIPECNPWKQFNITDKMDISCYRFINELYSENYLREINYEKIGDLAHEYFIKSIEINKDTDEDLLYVLPQKINSYYLIN
jgi:5'-3' exonuclease